MIVSDTLGIPLDAIEFVQSDTALVPRGGGTGGSRSLQMGGTAVLRGRAKRVLEQGRGARGAPARGRARRHRGHRRRPPRRGRRPGIGAHVGRARGAAASDDGAPLAAELDIHQDGATFPFGAHIAVVEVDTETGRVELLRHVAVDDCGRILNPLIVGRAAARRRRAGRGAGAVGADGLRRRRQPAHREPRGLRDAERGRAAARSRRSNTETPTPLNPLGAKGIGESGTIGSTPAVQNAVVDALAPSRHPPRRHAVHAGARVAGDPWRHTPARCRTRGASRPRSSTTSPRAGRTRARRVRRGDGPVSGDEASG